MNVDYINVGSIRFVRLHVLSAHFGLQTDWGVLSGSGIVADLMGHFRRDRSQIEEK